MANKKILNWEDYFNYLKSPLPLPKKKKELIKAECSLESRIEVDKSLKYLTNNNHYCFFSGDCDYKTSYRGVNYCQYERIKE